MAVDRLQPWGCHRKCLDYLSERYPRVRVQPAKIYTEDGQLSLEEIAQRCGWANGRQFRRVWKQKYGEPPSHYRQKVERDS